MRKLSIFLSTFVLLALLLTACGGEETSTNIPNANVPPVTAEVTGTSEAGAETGTPATGDLTTTPGVPVTGENSTSRVSNLLDFTLWNQNGEQVGDVEDLVLDLDNVNISYAVVGTGGFLDLGDKEVLIPWDQLQVQTGGAQENAFVLLSDPEFLRNAPNVDLNTVMPGMGQPASNWDADIRNFWDTGTVPGASAADTPAANTPAVGVTASPEMTATTTTGGASSGGATTGSGQGVNGAMKLQGVVLASDVVGATVMISPQGQGNGQGQGQGTGNGQAAATTTPDGTAAATAMPEATATTTTGTGNSGSTGSDLDNMQATVSDLIVDPATGEIQYLVISGSFTEGERWIPVPIGFLRWDATTESFVVNISGNALQNAPSFQEDQFPDTSTSGWDTDFNDFWQNQGIGDSAGVGTVTAATATP